MYDFTIEDNCFLFFTCKILSSHIFKRSIYGLIHTRTPYKGNISKGRWLESCPTISICCLHTSAAGSYWALAVLQAELGMLEISGEQCVSCFHVLQVLVVLGGDYSRSIGKW